MLPEEQDALDLALRRATREDNLAEVNRLLEEGASCMRISKSKWTAVDIAIVEARTEILQAFLESGQVTRAGKLAVMTCSLGLEEKALKAFNTVCKYIAEHHIMKVDFSAALPALPALPMLPGLEYMVPNSLAGALEDPADFMF